MDFSTKLRVVVSSMCPYLGGEQRVGKKTRKNYGINILLFYLVNIFMQISFKIDGYVHKL